MLTTTAPFSVQYHSRLHQLFELLNAPWSNNPAVNAQTAQDLWLGDEHGRIIADYDNDLLDAVIRLCGGDPAQAGDEGMNMRQAILPPDGTILDATAIVGGTLKANVRRYGLVTQIENDLNCQLGPIVGWYGQRLREERDGTPEQIIEQLRQRDVRLLDHPWVKLQLALGAVQQLRFELGLTINPWEDAFATEYEIGITAALIEFGPEVTIAHTEDIEEISQLPGVPGRTILWQRLTRPGGSDLIMFNAAAQERVMNGRLADPRHTTASSAQEWLKVFPLPVGAEVGIISGNPHTLRTIMDIDRQLTKAGRGDLRVTVMGTSAANSPYLAKAMLGEVARLLNNEQQAA